MLARPATASAVPLTNNASGAPTAPARAPRPRCPTGATPMLSVQPHLHADGVQRHAVECQLRPHQVVGERLTDGHDEGGSAAGGGGQRQDVPELRDVREQHQRHRAGCHRGGHGNHALEHGAVHPKKNGAMARADETPVRNAEPVSSNTSQPVTTQFIPSAEACSSTHSHSSRKSAKANERAHLGELTTCPAAGWVTGNCRPSCPARAPRSPQLSAPADSDRSARKAGLPRNRPGRPARSLPRARTDGGLRCGPARPAATGTGR